VSSLLRGLLDDSGKLEFAAHRLDVFLGRVVVNDDELVDEMDVEPSVEDGAHRLREQVESLARGHC
jgi:hypothetical protein